MKRYDILVVDDDPDVLAVISWSLEEEGYHLTSVLGGEAAVEAMRQKDFDLVITDLTMPQIDGIAVLKKAKELNPKTRVIILTTDRGVDSAICALRHDANDYVLKPFSLPELQQRVASCLNQSKIRFKKAYPDSSWYEEGVHYGFDW